MKKVSKAFLAVFAIVALLLSSHGAVQAKPDIAEDTVFKGRGHATLYYLSSDGRRLVFPNEKTYFSWFDDFSNVVEVDDSELAQYPLRGNVRYRPGALLVKVQSDPKVYAVGVNGNLRWVTSERLAKKLYGDNWSLLVDDVPVAFFINYTLGDEISDETEFDPEDEEDQISTISQNRIAKIKAKVFRKIATAKTRICNGLEKRLNQLQRRLERRGITVTGVGDGFVSQCVEADDSPGDGDKKVTICHIPPGDPEAATTISVGAPAARAHLSHGDTLGECEDGDGGEEDDVTAPVISSIVSSVAATSTVVTWTTDEESTSAVEYADESLAIASSTIEVSDDTLVTSHSLELVDLATSTLYFFIVESRDVADNIATSTEQMFTTLP